MLRKIIVKILFSFVLITQVQSAESGGMPQLNPEFWISQIVWLVITFGALYVILSKVILPKISNNLESRRSQILENIESFSGEPIFWIFFVSSRFFNIL